MDPFRRVFVAIDFSPASDEALRQAHVRANFAGADLAVCHIVPNELRSNLLFPQFSERAALRVPVDVERAAEAVSKRVEEITGRTGRETTILADYGTPYAEILKAAENWGADLIVLGSHGMTRAAGVLLGSVTHKVIRYAHATVLIVRAGSTGNGIVAGTDFSDPALPAISAAIHEASSTKQSLTIVHSIDLAFWTASHTGMAFGGPAPMLSEQDLNAIRSDAQSKLLEILRRFGAEGETVVAMGPPAPALVQIAEDKKANLLVVGTKGLTGFGRVLLGSVAERVASEAPCSVLIVRLH